jgi:uncharacterized membrane protein YedE/YeeE
VNTVWLVIAGFCITVAAVFLLRGNFDAAFVVAVLGMVAWFLNYRTQVQKTLNAEDATAEEENETDGNEDQ